jgi:hypothetical protein
MLLPSIVPLKRSLFMMDGSIRSQSLASYLRGQVHRHTNKNTFHVILDPYEVYQSQKSIINPLPV